MNALRVLLVEDEPVNRALIRAIIARDPEAAGVVLHEAGTIAGARELLAREPIDVVLLDGRLPDGSGLDLVRDVRAGGAGGNGRTQAAARTPLIAIVSGSVLEVDREAAAAAGADAFLGKPYSPSALTALLAMFSERLRQDGVAVES